MSRGIKSCDGAGGDAVVASLQAPSVVVLPTFVSRDGEWAEASLQAAFRGSLKS